LRRGWPTGAMPSVRLTVVGCGHVGLVMAAGFAKLGHEVIGLDQDPDLVAELDRGIFRVQETGLPQLIASARDSGRLRFTTDYDDAIAHAQFIFLAVDTPQTLGGAADLRSLRAAALSIAASLNGTAPIVVNKSTAPIGTGDMLEALLWRERSPVHPGPRVVSNPEFLQQGRAVQDFFEPDRIVVGAREPADAQAVADLYAGLPGELVLTSRRTAEMIKYVANAFLATRISFINEVAQLCEVLDVDVDDVVAGIAQDERIGSHFFRPGIGYGGSCLPKDTAALRFMGESSGVHTPLLTAVQQVNETARTRTIRRLREAMDGLDGRRLAVWGLTFKGGTEDIRQSPAIEVTQLLVNEGAQVTAYDPSQPSRSALPSRSSVRLAASALDAVDDVDALVILTDWREFAQVPLRDVRSRMHGDLILDGRNVLARNAVQAHGMRYLGVGRGRSTRPAAVLA
jgi:UDPglucose 6-dehydrogenase